MTALQLAAEHDHIDIINLLMRQPFYDLSKDIFKNCKKLTNFIIPNRLSSIGDSAFYGCSSLAQIVIPTSIKSIGPFAFYRCNSLIQIEIPLSVISIGKYAFSKCSLLEDIAIPSSITSIENDVFSGCSSLKNIIIPSSVKAIGDYAFFECSSLVNVIIPSSVTSIGEYCFSQCEKLQKIDIPDSVESIGMDAFDYELNQKCKFHSQRSSLYAQKMQLLGQHPKDLYQTPKDLVEEFQALNGKHLDFRELKDQILAISSKHNCKYTCFVTGESKKTQVFRCKHYNTCFHCEAFVKFYFNEDKQSFILDTMNNEHSHMICQVAPDRNMYTLTSEQKKKIEEYTKIGLTAGRIRLLENLYCSPQNLYNARRETLKQLRMDEMKLLLDELDHCKNWEFMEFHDNDQRFTYLYGFHEPILNSFYSTNVCAVDDTSCTNFFGYYLFVMISADENNRNQLLAFSLLPDKATKTIVNFFIEVKKRIGNIETFLTDRAPSQIEAIKNAWPETNIIFCAIHIGRNLKTNVGVEMLHYYDSMRNGIITEEELLTEFRKYITDHQNDPNHTKGVSLLTNLINDIDHWLPSMINMYDHCGNDTTNRVEGFFGNLKVLTDHGILTFHLLIRSIFIVARQYLNSSNKEVQKSINSKIISLDDQTKISNFALTTLVKEFNELQLDNDDDIEYSQFCCETNMIYRLPCRHLMKDRILENKKPLLTLNDIPLRWTHNIDYQHHIEVESKVDHIEIETNDELDWTYSSLIGTFGKFFSVASRSFQIRTAIRKFYSELKSIEVEAESSSDLLPPNNLPIPGPRNRFPRKNVDFK